jgi:hypothetical protein
MFYIIRMKMMSKAQQNSEVTILDDEPVRGFKNDSGKIRFDLLPPKAIEALAEVYTMGAVKYPARNWEAGIEYGRVYAAVQRHLHAFWSGQDLDEESALPHLAHAMWGMATLLEFGRTHPELDDRP